MRGTPAFRARGEPSSEPVSLLHSVEGAARPGYCRAPGAIVRASKAMASALVRSSGDRSGSQSLSNDTKADADPPTGRLYSALGGSARQWRGWMDDYCAAGREGGRSLSVTLRRS